MAHVGTVDDEDSARGHEADSGMKDQQDVEPEPALSRQDASAMSRILDKVDQTIIYRESLYIYIYIYLSTIFLFVYLRLLSIYILSIYMIYIT